MPDFLIRAHRRRDGCGARRSHQIDRRPPFVRMGPAVSARASNIGQGRAIKRCTALPFLCSTSFARHCGVAVRRRRGPIKMLPGPVHVRRTCSNRPGPTQCPGLAVRSEPAEPLRLYSFAPAGGARRQRVLPTSFLNTNNSSQGLRGCLVPSSEIFWPGCAGPRSRWLLRRLLRGKRHRRQPPRRSAAPIAAHANTTRPVASRPGPLDTVMTACGAWQYSTAKAAPTLG
jgi:hypothetical protein